MKSFSETESSDESIRSYLANGVHNSFYVDIREFDDGIAFRYRIPANGPKCVYGESTSFVFPSNHNCMVCKWTVSVWMASDLSGT
ncbi:glycoside hydrolase family 97 N-terminal domain-containing protein [Phocaeicola coprophilus]|uniref:glycoside hydrolase family 97 N-terminal domain-containing protein n=1 Tax=Phocaeicola coprophilus TaxID=387090 RepID=UPI00352009FA